MKNKNVGYLIIGISAIIGFIILLFNISMKKIVSQSCSHGSSCAMYSTITTQTYLSIAIAFLVLIIGVFLAFSKEEKQKTIIKPIKEKTKPINYALLDKEEKIIMKTIEQAEGTIFQSDLAEKTNFDKVKVTRILDRLEGRQLIERKRRGMTNVVILKR